MRLVAFACVLLYATSLHAGGWVHSGGKGSVGRRAPGVAWANATSTLFQGTNDVVDLGEPANMIRNLSNTELTVSVWFYVTSLATQVYVVAKAAPFEPAISWIIGVNTDGSLFAYFGSAAKTTQSAAGQILVNTWYHASLTVRSITGTYTGNLWRNGVKVGSDVTSLGTGTATGKSVRIGAGYVLDAPDTALPFTGNIDEVTFWSVGMTSSELLEIYNSAHPFNPSLHSRSATLLHAYRMGDGDTFPTTTDRFGTAHGTCTNMVNAATNFVSTVP